MKHAPSTDLAFAHAVRYRDAMRRSWMKRTKQGNSYRPEDVPAYIDPPTNEDRSRAEVIEFKLKPLPYGESYFAYLASDKATITTFTGAAIATVTCITSRRDRTSYITDERGSFWAKGIDGRIYYGRHNGAGVYCRMRLAKHQPLPKFRLVWSPEGKPIATVRAADARAAIRKAPQPYRKYLGEIYAELLAD